MRKINPPDRLFHALFTTKAISGIQYDANKLVVGTKEGFVICTRNDDKKKEFTHPNLLFKTKVNDLHLVPVYGEMYSTNGGSISSLAFTSAGMITTLNKGTGIINFYDIFWKKRTSPSSIPCLVQ